MPRVKQFNENEVLEKAMHLFWKKGYYATSIQDLVNHLSINRASLYDTYGGKKKLFESAFKHYRSSNLQGLKQFLENEPEVKEGFKKLFTTAVHQACSDKEHKGCFVVNTTIEFIPNEHDFIPLISENKTEFEQLFYNYLLQGVERGQLSSEKDLKSIASLFFAFYNGLKVVTKTDFNKEQFENSVMALVTVLD